METLFKSRQTILELLEDRGYPNVSSKKMNLGSFKKWAKEVCGKEDFQRTNKEYNIVKEEMTFTEEGPNGLILVTWHSPPKLGSQDFTNLVARLRGIGVKMAIVIVEDSLTHCAKSTSKSLKQDGTRIEIFTTEETQYNVSHHHLVPLHQVCTREEKTLLMKSYAVSASQLPNIKITDPMARYLGVTKGQLVKITRDSDTMPGQKTISYRSVI